MTYFSGFCFKNESKLFFDFLENSDYVVSGFSYGAIKAIEFALNNNARIEKIQLLSPAFFNDKDEKFIRLQMINFKFDKDKYIHNFINNMQVDNNLIEEYFKDGTKEELNELLSYNWDLEKLKKLTKKGIVLEVFLGANDKIIDSFKAKEFFEKVANVYMIKDVGHILK